MSATAVRAEPEVRPDPPRPSPGRHRRPSWITAFAVGLEVALFAPLLTSGTVWLLDSPSHLMGPHPRLASPGWESAPWMSVRAPFEALLAAIYRWLPWGQVRLLPLLVVPVIVVVGFRRLFAGERVATIAASLLYVVNPFTYDRMMAGQEYFLLAMAILPAILAFVVRSRNPRRSGAVAGLVLGAAIALSPHLAFIGGVLLLSLLGAAVTTRARPIWVASLVAMVTALTLSLAWAAPALVAGGDRQLGSTVFRTTPDAALGLLPNVLGLYGFWRSGWPLAKDFVPLWPLFVVAIIAVGVVGVSAAHRTGRSTLVLGTALAGLVGTLLAMGDRGPTGEVFAWFDRYVPAFAIMREPQKFLALLLLAYAIAFGFGVSALVGRAGSHRSRAAVLAILLLVPCAASFRSFWGFGGAVRPSPLPISWIAADRLMGPGNEAVLVLPWHRYLSFGWTQGRVVASPLVSAFERPTIASNDPEIDGLAPAWPDPRAEGAEAFLRSRGTLPGPGGRLSSLGISYIALAKVADWQTYAWLERHAEVERVAGWSDLVLYRVRGTEPTNA
jgi:hypothetical protein